MALLLGWPCVSVTGDQNLTLEVMVLGSYFVSGGAGFHYHRIGLFFIFYFNDFLKLMLTC